MSFFCPDCNSKVDKYDDTDKYVYCSKCEKEIRVPDEQRKGVLAPGTKVEGFEIIRLIGVGGMGRVYEAMQISLNRHVAIKILNDKYEKHDDAVRRFLSEVRASASLQHPNIVTVYEANRYSKSLYLAMALVEGESVDKILARTDKPIAEEDALHYCLKVSEAMDYAWNHQKLLHRDIKPANIIITDEGEVKLCDLGIAKRASDTYDITQAGMAIGTPHYMSPEQGQGRMDLDFRADIYSLGTSLFHMATATLPFDDKSPVQVITMHIMQKLPSPRKRNQELSLECETLIYNMMAKDRHERYDSWTAVIDDIKRVQSKKTPLFSPKKNDMLHIGNEDLKTSEQQIAIQSYKLSNLTKASVFLAAMLSLITAFLYIVPQNRSVVHSSPLVNQKNESGRLESKEDPRISQKPRQLRISPTKWEESLDLSYFNAKQKMPVNDDERVEFMIKKARSEERTAIYAARQFKKQNNDVLYEKCLWFIVDNYQGPDGKWAASAAERLLLFYTDRQDKNKQLKILTRMTGFNSINQPITSLKAYLELADFYESEGRFYDAKWILQNGIKKHENVPGISGTCAIRLVKLALDQQNIDMVNETLSFIVKNQAQNSRSWLLAKQAQEAIKKNPITIKKSQAVLKKERLNKRIKKIQARMKKQDGKYDKAIISFRIAELYFKEKDPESAIDHLKTISAKWGGLNNGEIGGKAYFKLANYYKSIKKEVDFKNILSNMLLKKYHGRNNYYGWFACNEMVMLYEKKKDIFFRNQYLKRIIENFPGESGNNAGKAAMTLAHYYYKEKNLGLTYAYCRQVISKYPGHQKQNLIVAEELMTNLLSKNASEILKLVPSKDNPYLIDFNSVKRNQISVKERNNELSKAKAITVEIFFRQHQESGNIEYLVARHGNNNIGFSLHIQNSILYWSVGNGKNDTKINSGKVKTSSWMHVVATAEAGKMNLYVNSKLVAESKLDTIENDGAGRIKIGRVSWIEKHLFSGDVLMAAVYPINKFPNGKIHFKYKESKNAYMYMIIENNKAVDVKKNKMDYRGK